MRVHFRTTRSALVGGVVALALTLTGCSGSSGGSTTPQDVTQDAIDEALSTPTTLTFWTWNDVQSSIDAFEEKYPAITVDMVNVGSGSDFYTKLRSAIKAGNGAPDVAQVEYQHIPSFVLGGDLADLSPYLDDSTADSFESFAWNQVVVNDGVYGIPQDTGPVGLLYREDIFPPPGTTSRPRPRRSTPPTRTTTSRTSRPATAARPWACSGRPVPCPSATTVTRPSPWT
jgi:multiple sugar transport system substrate-binding protein